MSRCVKTGSWHAETVIASKGDFSVTARRTARMVQMRTVAVSYVHFTTCVNLVRGV